MATKTALLIVDMQNDFTKPGARAYYPTTEKLMETFEQKINVLRNKGVQIVIIYSLVPDDHKPDPELTRITKTTRTLVEEPTAQKLTSAFPTTRHATGKCVNMPQAPSCIPI